MAYPKSKKLTKAEQKWVDELQAVLDRCPSERLGFYTIGDNNVFLYDLTHSEAITKKPGDLINILKENGWGFDETIDFPQPVEGVCG